MTDLDAMCFVKSHGRLVARDVHSDDWMATVAEGREVMLTPRKARNVAHHRKAFALFRLVIENDPQSRWMDETALLDDLKKRIGYGDWAIDGFTGYLEWRPKSISFAAMSQSRFEAFFNRACHILATEILSMAPQALVDEVMNMIEPQKRDAA